MERAARADGTPMAATPVATRGRTGWVRAAAVLAAAVSLAGCGRGVEPVAEARAEPVTQPPILVQAERSPAPGFTEPVPAGRHHR
jgi:hypothetical protein